LLRPAVGQFVESMMRPGGTHYQVEELTIEPGSALAGVSLKDSRLHEEFGIVVLTLRPSSGTVLYNPWGDTVLEGGSVILVAGPRPQLEKVKERSRRP
jgi:voltage-gated potassium channel